MGIFKQAEAKMANPSLILRRIDDIIKSEEDKRQYRGVELTNRMKILLVSDPNTDKSAAAMDVNVGRDTLVFRVILCVPYVIVFLLF